MKLKNSFKGFTLVEVLIVIIIVGILIAALLPRLQGTQERARDTARQGHINQIAQAAALHLADNPNAVLTGCVDDTWAASGNLSSIPTDPQGSNGQQANGTCTEADEYEFYVVAGGLVALAEMEGDNGNCTQTTIAGGAKTLNETTGDSFCVAIQ